MASELIHAGRLTPYQAQQLLLGRLEHLVLGDYVILEEIGRGGMGRVFKAWRRTMERVVALKVLSEKALGSKEAVERFRREVRAAARLEHPNIVTAYDAGEARGVHFLVMQYVEGQDLGRVLAERAPLPIHEVVDWMLQAARGLAYAHQLGVVHRDIKPGTCELPRGKRELLAWSELGPKAIGKMFALARGLAPFSAKAKKVPVTLVQTDKQQQTAPATQSGDWLAAGLLALASGDPAGAEKHFEHAQSLGADTGPYLAPLAAATFARAVALMAAANADCENGQFPGAKEKLTAADALLANLSTRYTATPWLAQNQPAVDAACQQCKTRIYQTEAEALYHEAVKLYNDQQFFECKRLVEKLFIDYPDSSPVTDSARKPSFRELQEAVGKLGKFLIVRKDGKGNFTTIQEAIDASPPNSLIEIQDNGPYLEKLSIPRAPLTIRAKKGYWPIIRSVFRISSGFTSEGLILFEAGDSRWHGAAHLRSCVVCSPNAGRRVLPGENVRLDNCVIVGHQETRGHLLAKNSIFIGGWCQDARPALKMENVLVTGAVIAGSPCEIRSCTINGKVTLTGPQSMVIDCIMAQIEGKVRGAQIEQCNVYHRAQPFLGFARPGKGCLNVDPMFVDPPNYNYTLAPKSPCARAASDRGPMGVRFTKEMIEVFSVAAELRRRMIIKF